MKKSYASLFGTTFLFLISSIFGNQNNSVQASPTQQKPVPFDADLFSKNRRVVFTNLEFLYWTIEEDALDYAIKMTRPNLLGTNYFPQGVYRNAKFSWDPGYRISVGYFNAPDYWEVMVQYTWLYSGNKNTAHKPAENDLFLNSTLNLITDQVANPITAAASQVGVHYHVGDLLANRVYITNPHLRLKILGGLTAGWLKQNWNIRYHFQNDDIERIRHQWRFFGLGFRFGLAGDWFWGRNFYLTAKFSTAVLVGRYRNTYIQKILTNPTPSNSRDTFFKDYRPAFTAQFIFGPSWQKSFSKSRMEIFLGYEMTPWINVQENYRTQVNETNAAFVTHNQSMLLFQGLTTRLTLDF